MTQLSKTDCRCRDGCIRQHSCARYREFDTPHTPWTARFCKDGEGFVLAKKEEKEDEK